MSKQVIIPPLAIQRGQEFVESWREQSEVKEVERLHHVMQVHKAFKEKSPGGEFTPEIMKVLDKHCPMREVSCHYPSDCQFLEICYREVTKPLAPEGPYWWRVPHHEAEAKALEAVYGPVPEAPKVERAAVGTMELEEDEY